MADTINDIELARKLRDWNEDAYRTFTAQFGKRIWAIAVKWCGLCHVRQCPHRSGGPFFKSVESVSCETAYDIYMIIVEVVLDRLKSYRGECSLASWITPTLFPGMARPGNFGYKHLYAEYLRRANRRFTVPECVKRKHPPLHHRAIEWFARGQTVEQVAERLKIDPEKCRCLWEELSETLGQQDPEFRWRYLGGGWNLKIVSLSSESTPEEDEGQSPLENIADPGLSVEDRARVLLLSAAIHARVRQEEGLDQTVLALAYDAACYPPITPEKRTGPASDEARARDLEVERTRLRSPLSAPEISDIYQFYRIESLATPSRVNVRLRTLRRRILADIRPDIAKTDLKDSLMADALDICGAGRPDLAEAILKKYQCDRNFTDGKPSDMSDASFRERK
ncbi:MAG: hypothetical protein ACLQVD_19595 [Capsulimonadaceae bacterium]